MSWHHHAACLTGDPEDFFSEDPARLARARALCASCPVRQECSSEGREEQWGVWGGTVKHRTRINV